MLMFLPAPPHSADCRAAMAPLGEDRCEACAWIREQQAFVMHCDLVGTNQFVQHFDGCGRG